MERGKVIGVGITVTLWVFALVFVPIGEYAVWLWGFAFTGIVGDTVTTSLFSRYGLEEQPGFVRRVCGPQPSLKCMAATRVPVLIGAGSFYLIWKSSVGPVQSGSYTIPPEGIPLLLAIIGGFAIVWNVTGYWK